jgi:hypothetical protein
MVRVVVMIAGIGFLSGLVPAAESGVTVTGDSAAWNEINNALTRLRAQPGWRIRETASGKVIRTWEFAPPNWHLTDQSRPIGTIETAHVGTMTATRYPGPPGCVRGTSSRSSPFTDLKDWVGSATNTGQLAISRQPDTTINATVVHAYAYVLTGLTVNGTAYPVQGSIYIGAQTGLPVRSTGSVPGGIVTEDYYDVGASIVITLPC